MIKMNWNKAFLLGMFICSMMFVMSTTVFADISKSNWEYQGKLKYNYNYLDKQYEMIKWEEGEGFKLVCDYPNLPNKGFTKALSFEELRQEGYEYILRWRAKRVKGTSYIDSKFIPIGEWSPAYTTHGLTLQWRVRNGAEVIIDYVELYVRKVDVYREAAACWEFEDGTLYDSSINSNEGTIVGNAIPNNEPGIVNEALKLDSTNYVEIPHSDELQLGNSSFAVSFWYKANPGEEFLFDKTSVQNGIMSGYKIISSGKYIITTMYLNGKKLYMSCPNMISYDNQWHHVVVEYDTEREEKNSIIYYHDEDIGYNYVQITPGDNFAFQNTEPLKIGDGTFKYTSLLDEIVIYKRAIPYNEITDIYTETLNRDIEDTKKLHITFDSYISDNSFYRNDVDTDSGYLPEFEKHTDVYNNAARFTNDDSFTIRNNPQINFGTGDFSLSCWFKTTKTSTANTIISKREEIGLNTQGYMLTVFHGESMLFQMGDENRGFYNYYYYVEGENLHDDNWHHVAVSVDRDSTTGVKIFVDGELKFTGNATYRQGSIDNSEDLLIGMDKVNYQDSFEGSIDEVILFDRSISEKEAKQLYGKKKWNCLLYMNGDNNLEGQMIDEINNIEKCDFEEDINVFVLLDRNPEGNNKWGDWTGTKLLKVREENLDDLTLLTNSVVLKDYGELDMGDSKNLEDFITYCQNNYPADRTYLSIQNHGAGIKGISLDDTSGNIMQIAGVKQALNNAMQATEKKIDVLYFDACLMQMVEILYQLRDSVDYIVGSEHLSHGFSLDNEGFYNQFVQNAGESTKTILDAIEDNSDGLSQSAVETKGNNMIPFKNAFNAFTVELVAHSNYAEIETAYSESRKVYSGNSYPEFLDLINFVTAVHDNTTNQQLKNSAQNLIDALSDFQYFYKGTYNDYYGISIYFPDNRYEWLYRKDWYRENYELTDDTMWDEFLDEFFNM